MSAIYTKEWLQVVHGPPVRHCLYDSTGTLVLKVFFTTGVICIKSEYLVQDFCVAWFRKRRLLRWFRSIYTFICCFVVVFTYIRVIWFVDWNTTAQISYPFSLMALRLFRIQWFLWVFSSLVFIGSFMKFSYRSIYTFIECIMAAMHSINCFNWAIWKVKLRNSMAYTDGRWSCLPPFRVSSQFRIIYKHPTVRKECIVRDL